MKTNRRHLVVYSTTPQDCIKINKKSHSTDNVHFHISFSHKYIYVAYRERGINMNSQWFTENIMQDITQLLVDNHFQLNIQSCIYLHDNCSSYRANRTQRFIQ